MTSTRKIIREFPHVMRAIGWKRYVRGYQPLKADGSDAKREPRFSNKQLHIHQDGSYRVYNSNGVLCRERVSEAVRAAEYREHEAASA